MRMRTVLNLSGTKKTLKLNYTVSGASICLKFNLKGFFYKIFRKNPSDEFEEFALSAKRTVYLDFLPLGRNFFKVQLLKNDCCMYESSDFCVNINVIEPYCINPDDNEVLTVWNRVEGSDGYTLYEKTADHLFTSFKDTVENEALFFKNAYTEEFKIKPYKLENSAKKYVFPAIKFFAQGKFNKAKSNWSMLIRVKHASAKLFWKAVKSADCYKIYCESGNKLLKTVNTNFCEIKKLPAGNTYFTVSAYKKNCCISKSVIMKCTISSMELSALNFDNGSIMLYWNEVPQADGYMLYKKNNIWEGVLNTKETKTVLSNVMRGEPCEYMIKPYVIKNNAREVLKLSAKCKIKVYTTAKIQLYINAAYNDKMALSWYFDGDVDGYMIFKGEEPYLQIDDGLAHIALIDYSKDKFKVKGYKKLYEETVYTCESEFVGTEESVRLNHFPETFKVSVIMPAYNSQDYISRSISAVLGSDIDDVELVIVDDGSRDNTREIIDWYVQKYPQYVKKIYKTNGGVADARNTGIKAANGKYVTFLDNDDLIRPHAYSALYDAIETSGSDIAVAPLYKIDNDKYSIRHRLPFKEKQAINVDDYLKLIFTDKFNNIGVWNKLYKTDLVREHPFGLLSYEDVSYTPYILSWADTFCYINTVCYEWDRKIRPATFSNELSNRSAEEKFKERHDALKFFLDNGNPKRRECLAYIMAKRLYAHYVKAKYDGYFAALKDMKAELLNNKFLSEDKEYSEKIKILLSEQKGEM